jgi:hypothetical protein
MSLMQRFSLSGLSPRGLYQRGQQAKPPAQPQRSPREEELPQSGPSFFSRHPCPVSCVGKNWKRRAGVLIYVGAGDEARHLLEELLSDEAAYGQQLHTLCHVRTQPTTIVAYARHTQLLCVYTCRASITRTWPTQSWQRSQAGPKLRSCSTAWMRCH